MTLLIMAAGLASRYGGNKQTDGFGPKGEMLMEYSIRDAKDAGFDRVVFIIAESMKGNFVRSISERVSGVETAFAVQNDNGFPEWFTKPEGRTKPYGTVHAVLCAKEYIDEPFVVINADDYYGREAVFSIAAALKNMKDTGEGCMLGYRLGNTLSGFGTVTRGICQVENGILSSICETYNICKGDDGVIRSIACEPAKELNEEDVVSMNIFGFAPWIFDELEKGFDEFLRENGDSEKAEFPIPVLIDSLVKNGKISLRVVDTDSVWFGVTYKEDKAIVTEKIARLLGSLR